MNNIKLFLPKIAEESISKVKKSDVYSYKKIEKLLVELSEHPKTGTGHPEPLIGGNDITYSRSVSKKIGISI